MSRTRKPREKKRAAAAESPGESGKPKKGGAAPGGGDFRREWIDPLLVAFLLAMFIRLFGFELFRIPSSSMTPTLLGTDSRRITFVDVDGDGDEDLVLKSPYAYDLFEKRGGRYYYEGKTTPGQNYDLWTRKAEKRQDQIIVAKFFYWFAPPKRGDIAVFKTPKSIFEPHKPIYIKRVAALPGETIDFEPAPGVAGHLRTMGYLVADGRRVTEPPFFREQRYEYRGFAFRGRELGNLKVPEDGVLLFGDNTVGSKDSRYWGHVPLENLRGRAILRFSLFHFLRDFKFLK